jgi:nucleoside-diphosphate-sugar epimerase
VRRVVLLSSVAVYGHVEPDRGALDEADTCPRPNTLYGISKYAAEACALRADELEPLSLVVARLGPVFGPWERTTGVRDTLSPHWQATRLAAARRGAVLPHAGQADWLYSRDAAAGIVALLGVERPRHRVYNVGAGRRWPVSAWCARLTTLFPGFQWRTAAGGEEPNVRFQPDRERAPLGIERLAADCGYRPRFGLDEAFDDFGAWLRATPDGLAAESTGGTM